LPLAAALEREGYATRITGSAPEAIALAAELQPDLILLDVMLTDGSGLDVCREVRRQSKVPIIMLTARGDETDRVVGLELGADDYVVKPFSARELVARIRAVLRRVPEAGAEPAAVPDGEHEFRVDGLTVDTAMRRVVLDGDELSLTRREFDLLALLVRNAGTVLTRERLIDEVWDTNWFGSTKTLDVHVSSLRRKLGDDPSDPRFVHTVRGVGFRMAGPEEIDDG
jgi:DNA-binding response OmpR family regulator